MLAKHPLTGAPIRILNCENSVWRDQQTLVWLDEATLKTYPRAAWNRYDIGVSSLEAAAALAAVGIQPDIVIPIGSPAATASWLQSAARAQARIVAVPRAALEYLGQEGVIALRATNMVCLEECIQLYPFLDTTWDGSEADAKAMVAIILRYNRSFPVAASSRIMARHTTFTETIATPPPLILVTQYYRPEKAKRGREIDICLRKNVECPLVDQIVLLNEREDVALPQDLSGNSKITTKSIGGRLNFRDVIRWIAEEAPAGSYVAVANSDIYLDESWRALWSFDMAGKFLALLRWNDDQAGGEPTLFGPRADSQDTWVVAADSVKAVAKGGKIDWVALDIPFGKGGCDNAINVEMLRLKFLVANPALTLRTHHVHWSEIRSYNPKDIVDRPFYMHIHPTGIHDLKPEINLPQPSHSFEQPAVAIDIGASSTLTTNQIRTFQTMVAKKEPAIANAGFATPPITIPVHTLTDVFENKDGLVAGYDRIYIGKSKAGAAAWTSVEMSKVAPCVDTDCALVAPCPDSVIADPATYCLRYLGKILALRAATGDHGEFLAPKSQAIVDALGLFSWPTPGAVPVLRREENFSAFCRKAHVWLPQDGAAAWPTTAEVDALRGALNHSWEESVARKGSARVVVVLDDVWLTRAVVDAVETLLPPGTDIECITDKTAFPDVVHALRGAAGLVFKSGTPLAGAAWALPRDATLWELQFEMSPSLEAAHFALMAGLRHSLMIMPRPRPKGCDIDDFKYKLAAAIKGSNAPRPIPPLLSAKPTIYVPPANTSGFFGHAGDSFREMLGLWHDRGYVNVEPREGLKNVWLGQVGAQGVLLYDRPTMEWLNRSPMLEKSWRLVLMGNPAAKGAQKAVPWFFWPRRPALVERLAASAGATPWATRSKRLVFYGRSENAVQAARRTGADWRQAATGSADEFIHIEGEKPYPFTQEEYLQRLADARFGLCLAGYGYKCHREVECMSMGCVPVVAPEVDMISYADPPKEGVHYLRAATPAEAAAVIAAVDPQRWAQMSTACRVWWRRNASVEGSWELTRRLAMSA